MDNLNLIKKEIKGPNLNSKAKKPVDHLLRIGWSGFDWYVSYEFYQSAIYNKYGIEVSGWGKTPELAIAHLIKQFPKIVLKKQK